MRKLICVLLALCLAVGMVVPAFALEESIDAPDAPNYGKATSVEVVYTADGGAAANEDKSVNVALVPPSFGSPSAYALNTGEPLTPNLALGGKKAAGATVGGGPILYPEAMTTPSVVRAAMVTAVTPDLTYEDGSLGTLAIPAIGLTVGIYQGTDSAALAKGAGHFEETSIWDGNVALAGHNRGVNNHFGQIHTLKLGDKITLTTKLGTRTYEVVSVAKISETDRSGLAASPANTLTLYTCVRDQRAYRWCVQAVEIR